MHWTKNNIPHHCTTYKDCYHHVVTLYTQTDLKYRLVVKEKRNVYVYLLYVPIFQTLI